MHHKFKIGTKVTYDKKFLPLQCANKDYIITSQLNCVIKSKKKKAKSAVLKGLSKYQYEIEVEFPNGDKSISLTNESFLISRP